MRISPPLNTAFALLLTACTSVGPDYQLPEQAKVNDSAARQAFQGADLKSLTSGEAPRAWWHLYDVAPLNRLIETALAANSDLRVATANLARSEALLLEAESTQEVKIGTSATAVRARESGEAYLLPITIPVENLADAGVKLTYQIDLVGGLKRAAEAATADVAASRAALDLARIKIVAEVAHSYMEVCTAGHELDVARHNLKLQQENQAVIARLIAGGRRMAVDLPRAGNLVEQTRSTLPAYIARQRIALYQLAVLSGHPPGEYPQDLATCKVVPRLSSPIPVGDGAALLRRRPDIRQAERALAGATARIGIATAALYPTITLGFSTGATGILEHLGQAPTQRWSLGPLISWTFPGELEKARLRQADANADAALAHFDGIVLKALLDVENALTLLAQNLDRHTALQKARDEAVAAGHQVHALHQAGRLPYLDDLDAQRNQATAEAALAAADGQVVNAQIRLFLALGGGWGS